MINCFFRKLLGFVLDRRKLSGFSNSSSSSSSSSNSSSILSNVGKVHVISSIVFVLVVGKVVSESSPVKCPGIVGRWGVSLTCVLTTRGIQTVNCSSPMSQETVVYYGCEKYFRQKGVSSQVKFMRCDQSGRWTRVEHFINLKCEYECGKAQPVTKTLIVNGRIITRQIWPWHALIYFNLDPSQLPESSRVAVARIFPRDLSHLSISHPHTTDDDPLLIKDRFTTSRSSSSNVTLKTDVKGRNTRERSRRQLPGDFLHVYICGGSLISPLHVLTAAHCLSLTNGSARNPDNFTVILGGIGTDYLANERDGSSQILRVKRIHISSSFNYKEFEGDIAILTLASPVKFSSIIFPVCLPENLDDAQLFISNGKNGEVIGSRPEISGAGLLSLSSQLKSKKLHVLPTIECSRNIDRIPSDKEYCAGMREEFICGGDSGGGMISSPNFGLRRRYTIQGIVSYARARKVCENYAVFTRVYKFMDWIERIVDADG